MSGGGEEAIKIMREFRRQHGICVQCGNKLDRDGNYCDFCTEQRRVQERKKRKDRAEKGVCVKCGKPNDRYPIQKCTVCSEKSNKNRKIALDRRIAVGICDRCNNPAVPGHRSCQSCLDKKKEYFHSHKLKEIEK